MNLDKYIGQYHKKIDYKAPIGVTYADAKLFVKRKKIGGNRTEALGFTSMSI